MSKITPIGDEGSGKYDITLTVLRSIKVILTDDQPPYLFTFETDYKLLTNTAERLVRSLLDIGIRIGADSGFHGRLERWAYDLLGILCRMSKLAGLGVY